MKNKNTKKFVKLRQETKLLWILILAIASVFFWIVVSILFPKKEQIISQQLRELAKPLTPTLDQGVLSSIPAKRYLLDEELESFSIFVLVDDEQSDVPKLVDVVNQQTIEIIEPLQPEDQAEFNDSPSQLQQLSEGDVLNDDQTNEESVGNQEVLNEEML